MAYFDDDKRGFGREESGWGKSWPDADRPKRPKSGDGDSFGRGQQTGGGFPGVSGNAIKFILILAVIAVAITLLYVYRAEISHFLQLVVIWVITIIIVLIVLRLLFGAIFSRRR